MPVVGHLENSLESAVDFLKDHAEIMLIGGGDYLNEYARHAPTRSSNQLRKLNANCWAMFLFPSTDLEKIGYLIEE